jgi:glyoxylase-like metal-dependent hydrolase (beta-lactamase superfamily II)
MAAIVQLVFNDFSENTYIVYDETGECVIIDPGCNQGREREELAGTIARLQLRPVRLLNTHGHLDHVFGNAFVANAYGLSLEMHRDDLGILEAVPQVCAMYGITMEEMSPAPGAFLAEGDVVAFGQTNLEVLHTPGHSPGSISFYCRADNMLISGDVLFYGSVGRSDFPGGNHDTLIASIQQKLLPLGDDVTVYSGHGQATTIGFERLHNPFL